MTTTQLLHLLAHDSDPSTAGKPGSAWVRIAQNISRCRRDQIRPPADDGYIEALRGAAPPQLDAAFKALVLTLPGEEAYIAEQLDVVDPQRIHAVREAMREQLATALRTTGNGPEPTATTAPTARPVSSGRHRALAGLALEMLCPGRHRHGRQRLARQGLPARQDASNMTDRLNALARWSAAATLAAPLAQFPACSRRTAGAGQMVSPTAGPCPDRNGGDAQPPMVLAIDEAP